MELGTPTTGTSSGSLYAACGVVLLNNEVMNEVFTKERSRSLNSSPRCRVAPFILTNATIRPRSRVCGLWRDHEAY